jgi:hypothetical protein
MPPQTSDFEKLGVFYLGRRVDAAQGLMLTGPWVIDPGLGERKHEKGRRTLGHEQRAATSNLAAAFQR